MPWWRFLSPERDDDEIREYVAEQVAKGIVPPERAAWLEKSLREAAAGKSIFMSHMMRRAAEERKARRLPRSREEARR